jgi:hypothetical protein
VAQNSEFMNLHSAIVGERDGVIGRDGESRESDSKDGVDVGEHGFCRAQAVTAVEIFSWMLESLNLHPSFILNTVHTV